MVKKGTKGALFIMLAPAVLLYCIIYLYPTIRTTIMSFFTMDSLTIGMDEWKFAGWDNYLTLLESDVFMQSVVNIFKIWSIGGIIVLISALVFAVILTSGIKGKKFFRSVIYLPNIISAVALGTMWIQYVFNSEYGLLKTVFEFLGLTGLAEFKWTAVDNLFISMLIAYCFGMVGYFMLTYMAGIERIPLDFYEAASIEGSNIFTNFIYITLPLLKGIIKTTFVLWTVRSLGFFVWTQIFSPVVTDLQTVTPMVYMYQTVFGTEFVTGSAPGVGAAIGVVMVVVTIIMFGISNIIFKDSVEEF